MGWGWMCEHERTPENTKPSGQCRACFNKRQREFRRTPDGRDQGLRYRCEKQLDAARRKVAMLEKRAVALGLDHLVKRP